MKAFAFALSAALALALAACSSNQGSSKGSTSSSGGGTSGSSVTSDISKATKDSALTGKVKSALAADVGLRTLTGIDVDSAGPVVTLKGKVDTEANKKRAEQIAQGVEGVSSVKNQLTVEAK